MLSPKLFDEALLHLLHFMYSRFRTALESFERKCRAEVKSTSAMRAAAHQRGMRGGGALGGRHGGRHVKALLGVAGIS